MENLKVKREDLEFVDIDGGGIPIYNYQGKPFTGILLEYYNDLVSRELEYINGYQDGIETSYYETGRIEYQYHSKNNMLHGVCKEWDENGSLTSETIWEEGVKIKTVK